MSYRMLNAALLVAVATAHGVHEGGAEGQIFKKQAEMPASAHQHIRKAAENLEYRESIAELIERISETEFEDFILRLSGESSNSTAFTRRSSSISDSNGILLATDFLGELMQDYGLDVTLDTFRSDWGPNVVAVLPGSVSPDELVILGAHYDDIPANGRAPGANDDGSGSAALMVIASAIASAGVRFERTVVLEYYSGEEQGLVGSRALAAQRRQRGDTVIGQIQQDMTALKRANDPVGIAFVQSSTATDRELTQYVMDVSKLYASPELTLFDRVLSGSSCCSDHQSYMENGYPSVGLIEPRGYTGDPQYHRIGDLVRRADYSIRQAVLTAQIVLAATADLAVLIE